jgi:hypothetical protein
MTYGMNRAFSAGRFYFTNPGAMPQAQDEYSAFGAAFHVSEESGWKFFLSPAKFGCPITAES